MFRYLILRLWLLAITLVGVSLLIFVILQVLPGDAVDVLLLNWTSDTGEEFETLRRQLGLDRPWYEQYFGWLWDAMRGDLGRSFSMDAPVAPIVMQRLFFSLRLAIPALPSPWCSAWCSASSPRSGPTAGSTPRSRCAP